ncbi:MAG TPA: hypothetical protein VK625_18315 [Flavitalea sp.]|nr:hypothetical protein [Flavitalea sp.]
MHNKLDIIINLLTEINEKLSGIQKPLPEPSASKKKRVPLYKNEVLIESLLAEIIRDNDNKILKKLQRLKK